MYGPKAKDRLIRNSPKIKTLDLLVIVKLSVFSCLLSFVIIEMTQATAPYAPYYHEVVEQSLLTPYSSSRKRCVQR